MSTKIIFEPSIRGAMRTEVKALLEKYRHKFPKWLKELYVMQWQQQHEGKEGTRPDFTAEVLVKDEYRRVDLIIHKKWLDMTPRYREKTIRHEIAHMHQGPVDNYVHSILGNIDVTEDVYDMMVEQYRRVAEAMAEDLMELI